MKNLKAMKNLFVPFELAKQLKKEGFNETCLTVYKKNKSLMSIDDWSGGINNLYLTNDRNSDWHYCVAPLYQQVVDWFRDKHNIQIKVIAFDSEGKVKWYYECQDLTLVKTKHCKEKVFKFKTPSFNISNKYYQALDKAIKEALKLIK